MDGMDPQTRAKQIWIESHCEEPDPYFSYAGQKVYCPHCDRYVKIVTKIKDQEEFSEFKTSCGHDAHGSFSDGYDAEWCFWIN